MKWLISIFDAFFFDQFGKFSVSKFWSNFGMCVATYIIVVQAKTVSVELLLVYLIVLTGNHALIFWLKQKSNIGGYPQALIGPPMEEEKCLKEPSVAG